MRPCFNKLAKTHVVVLLSTWNGAEFLKDLLASISQQDFVGKTSVIVRDDGSSDETVEIIRANSDLDIYLIEGKNIGASNSFFHLLEVAKQTDGDYFALCDQDDIWLPHKVSRAVSTFIHDEPAIYSSALQLVDENLREIQYYRHIGDKSFSTTLLRNFVTGCTCVLNRQFLDWMPLPENPERVAMHDWWIANVATIGAQIYYDDESHILYRQHSSNAVGLKTGLLALIHSFYTRALHPRGSIRRQHILELKDSVGHILSRRQLSIIERFVHSIEGFSSRLLFAATYVRHESLRVLIPFVFFGNR